MTGRKVILRKAQRAVSSTDQTEKGGRGESVDGPGRHQAVGRAVKNGPKRSRSGETGSISRRQGKSPRVLASVILDQWFSGRERSSAAALDELISQEVERAFGWTSSPSRTAKERRQASDAALVREIVLGVVRWQRLLEWHIRKYAQKFGRLPGPVRAVLYAGAYQILFLTRIPFFAAVDESVRAVETLGAPWAKSLVNAVLRKLAQGKKIIPDSPDFLLDRCSGENFVTCCARFSSHPSWMVRRWTGANGQEVTARICHANNQRAPLALRVNTLLVSVEEAVAKLDSHGFEPLLEPLCPHGVRLDGFKGSPALLPGFDAGWFVVQDLAAQLVVLLTGVGPGMKVLDACAGVGGKSTYLAALMGDEGSVLAYDPAEQRLSKLEESCGRLGISSIRTFSLQKALEAAAPDGFDVVLVDAPCSGLGVIRRHPDIKWNRKSDDVPALANQQKEICRWAAGLLRPGGRLVYAVCTLEPEETFEIVKRIEETGLILLPVDSVMPELPADMVASGCLRILPGQRDMDGFFAAVFEKGGT